MSEDNPTIEELHPLRIAKHQVHLSEKSSLPMCLNGYSRRPEKPT